jgi:DNA-binding XRE family transcriptional regulator
MLAVVNQPPIRIEAPAIPDVLLAFLRKTFGAVSVSVPRALEDAEEDEGESETFQDSDFYKRVRATMTPSGNLKMLRTTFGVSRAQLAERTGYSEKEIGLMERGKSPIELADAKRLSNALGTSLENLYWEE